MIAYTGIETISNMAEEAKDEATTIPAAINRVRDRRVRDLLHAAGGRAVARCRSRSDANGEYYTLLGLPEEEGGFAGDPILGVVKQIDLGAAPGRRPRSTSACSPRRSSSSPRTRASSASRGSSTRWASTARCPTALRQLHPRFRTPWIGILVFCGVAIADRCCPGQADVPRQHVRVRRDAVVHDRARRGDPAADQRSPTSRGPTAGPGNVRIARLRRCRCSRSSAASFTAIAFVVDRRPAPRRGARSASAGWSLGIVVYVALPPPPGARPDHDAQGRDPAAGRRPRGRVRLGARRRSTTATTTSR